MTIDHDQIFKQLIEAFFQDFMELFCPGEAKLIDFSRVEFMREEYFTDVGLGNRRRLDLVVKVGLRSGGEKYVLVHVEFESSRKERDFPRRMYQYHCQLFLRHDLDIIPIAVFSDEARWREPVPDHFEMTVAGETIVRFHYRLIKLKHLDYREFLGSPNPLAYALMAKMDYTRRERVRLKIDFLRLILKSDVDSARKSLLIDFVETYVSLDPQERIEFEQIVSSDHRYEEVKKMVTVYEQKGIEKGIEQGIEQGIEKGIEKGKKQMLLLVLNKKFGPLSDMQQQTFLRIDSTQELDHLLLKIMDANSFEELNL